MQHRFSSGTPITWTQVLRRGLGVFWVIAGILQFQPLMFTPDFYAWYPSSMMESIIQSAADDQPQFVVSTVHLGTQIWSTHPVFFNVCAAMLQVVTGLLLFFGTRTLVKVGLALTVVWGLLVWVTAEAYGRIFGGSSYFDGFPGAVLLYVISALILISAGFRERSDFPKSQYDAIRYLVSIYWFLVAFFQTIPSSGFWEAAGLVEPFANEAAQPGPRFLAAPVGAFSQVVQSHAGLVNLGLIAVMVVLAFLTLLNRWNPVTITFAVAWLIWSWWFGQGFGAVFTGAGTDLNSIPVIGLWMVCLWVGRDLRIRHRANAAT